MLRRVRRIKKSKYNEKVEPIMGKQKTMTKKSKFDKFIAIAVVALAVIIVLTLAASVMSEMGLFLKVQTAASAGEVSIDGAMMSFYLNDYIMNWYNTYGSYASYGYISIDITSDLSKQQFAPKGSYDSMFLGEFKGTWYEYFMSSVKPTVERTVIYANNAKKNNLSLDAEDKAEIEEILKGIDTTLNSLGITYSDWYGNGVNKNVVRRCYELSYLAAKYEEKIIADYEAQAESNTGDIVEYRENHKSDFYTVDCLTYTISKTSKGMTDEEFDSWKASVKEIANGIASAKSPEEFVSLVEKYESESKEKETTSTTSTTATTSTTEATETESTEAWDKYETEIKYETETGTNADNSLNDFFFGNEETGTDAVESAGKYDGTIVEEEGTVTEKVTTAATTAAKKEATTESSSESASESKTETESGTKSESTTTNNNVKTYDSYKVTVYYVMNPSHFDTELTHNFSYLITNDKDAITKFIENFNANETKDVDAFIDIADKMSEELHSGEDHEHSDDEVFSYDILEKSAASAFTANYAKLNKWIEDANRQNNTLSDIIEIKITSTDSTTNKVTTKTQYGVIFFKDHAGATWYESAKSGLVNDWIEEWYAQEQKDNGVKFTDAINQIDTAKPFLATIGY